MKLIYMRISMEYNQLQFQGRNSIKIKTHIEEMNATLQKKNRNNHHKMILTIIFSQKI